MDLKTEESLQEPESTTHDRVEEEIQVEGVDAHPYVKAPSLSGEHEKEQGTNTEDAEMDELVAGVASLLSQDDGPESDSASAEAREAAPVAPASGSPPQTLQDARNRVEDMLQEVETAGIPLVRVSNIRFGKTLGEGAFGTVKMAMVTIDGRVHECAVKTIIAKGKKFNDCLDSFQTEANVSWAASTAARDMKQGQRSRVCRTVAISYDVVRVASKTKPAQVPGEGGGEEAEAAPRCSIKAQLHLVMEKVESRGDLHQEITSQRWWDSIREGGEDTGRRLRGNYTMTDDDGDLFAYTMPRRAKLQLAEEMARGMLELRASRIVHCDIKPCNVLLVSVPHAKAGKAPLPGLKIIDFGEGNTPEEATGYVAGTPGYQAPEVVEDGLCSFASDMYSTGVLLIELWAGDLWAGADTRGEGYDGMRKELMAALAKIEKADPKAARLLRRCVADKPGQRPSARQLLKAIKALRADAVPLRKVLAFKGRPWAPR